MAWWLLGLPTRFKTIGEGRSLSLQLREAKKAQETLTKTAEQAKNYKPNLLLPGAAVVASGLLASKIAADKFEPPSKDTQFKRNCRNVSGYMNKLKADNYANFVLFDTLATIENGLATTIHAIRNSRLKNKLNEINNANNVLRAGIEKQRMQNFVDVPMKLGGLALATGAIATPTIMYMNSKYKKQNTPQD